MPTAIGRRIVVGGRVQGVGYRVACAAVGERLGLRGKVRNLDDGRVEIVAVGSPELVQQLIEWCRLGPRAARVDDVVVTDEPAADDHLAGEGFRIA
jgi:acylphosphatase